MVPGQFGAGQFGADNSARTIWRWTIRRGQFGATIRLGQFSAKYDINFTESSAFIQQYSFHQSCFYLSNILFFNPVSISAILFSSIPLLFQQYFSLIPHPFQQYSFHQSRLVLNIMS